MTALIPPALSATIVLVRHGKSTWIAEGRFQGRADPPLSAMGQRQAGLVASRLAQRDGGIALPIPAGLPGAIWHSPLGRAAQTAAAIGQAQPGAVPLRALPALTEIAQGEWEGVPHGEVTGRWPDELAAWRRSPVTDHAPGGEALPDAARRVRGGLAEVVAALGAEADMSAAANPAAGRAAAGESPVPGYGAARAINAAPEPWAILVAHDGIFRLALMELLDVPLERFWSFPFNLCAISVVALREGRPMLRAHNLTEHLAPLADEARAAAEASGDRRGAL